MPVDGYDTALSVSRRALDVEDYVDIMRRQKAWIIGPTLAGLVIAVVVAFLWKDRYVSTAVVRVVPSQIPQELIASSIVNDMTQRINSMAQTILSRTTLTNIINVNNLYDRDRARLPMEDVVENMKKNDVRISSVMQFTAGEGRRQVPAFQISFAYEKRAEAQKVCQELVSKFLQENVTQAQNKNSQTYLFLKDQSEQKRRELEVVEQKLASYKVAHAGGLPDQVQQNLQQLNALEQRLSNLNSTISRITQDKLITDGQIRVLKDQLATREAYTEEEVTTQNKENAKNQQLALLEQEIFRGEAQLAAMREQYTDSHPDLKRVLSSLNVLKRKREEMEKEEAKKPAVVPEKKKIRVANPVILRERNNMEAEIKRMHSSIEAKDLELEDVKREAQRTEGLIKATQARLDATPLGEKEYIDLVRERDMVRNQAEDLSKRQNLAKIYDDVEKRQQGDTLEMLDPASLPQKPAEPDRTIIVGVGTVIGLAFGMFLAIGRELKDTSLKNLKDVRAYTQLQILGSIPLLENDLVVRRRRRLSMVAWSTAVFLGCMIMGGTVFYYYQVLNKT
ncbi:MAG: hypothetical protein HY820_43490 [Acidobacteria bacterium]|nr:hypothetical protein [Acidobacteriota bacterium]